jgi:transposase InsO family protein
MGDHHDESEGGPAAGPGAGGDGREDHVRRRGPRPCRSASGSSGASRPAIGPPGAMGWSTASAVGPRRAYLYVLLDIFSRYVVGWLRARREPAALAKVLVAESCARQRIEPSRLTIHADRGPSMNSQPVAGDPGRGALALQAAGLRRRPLFRGPLQDPQVPTRLPGAVRILRGCRGLLSAVLPLVPIRG